MDPSHPANPVTPNYADDWTYVDAYLAIHKMSATSYRYAYLLWFCIIATFLAFALLHWTGRRGGVVGAWWSKWSLRRRTWRKQAALEAARRNPQKHRQPFSFPSNAQLLSLFVLSLATFSVSFAGPDYIAPSARLWEFHVPDNRAVVTRDGGNISDKYNIPPSYTINKAWWTVGGRTGFISFSLLPLIVLFALKAPPFAILSLPFLLQLQFDKLVRLHRWSGALLWLIVTIHVATWGVQLGRDRREGSTNQVLWFYVWQYNKFIYGVFAYFFLTLLVLTSLPIVRRSYYEAFYFLHILLVPLTIIASALHFPPIAWWCWVTLGIWAGERLWRLVRFAWINGMLGSSSSTVLNRVRAIPETMEMSSFVAPSNQSVHALGYAEDFDPPFKSELYGPLSPESPRDIRSADAEGRHGFALPIPPTGHAYAILLPGRTIRLRIRTARTFNWSPGQHILLRVPSVSKFTTHPFTICSVYNANYEVEARRPQEIEVLIRAKAGFTRELWNEISRLSNLINGQAPTSLASSLSPITPGDREVTIKVQVDGPFGSSARARWGNFSSVLIIVGGSGVSYGLAILEFVCLCMSGRNSKTLGSRPGGWGNADFKARRVRFVWLVREYSHLQWCATTIMRCQELVPSTAIQIDIYVSNITRSVQQQFGDQSKGHSSRANLPQGDFTPPVPLFAQSSHNKRHSWSSISVMSDDDTTETPTASIYSHGGDDEMHPLDLTNFDGDDDSFLPGEATLSYQVHREGHLRRKETRRIKTLAVTPYVNKRRDANPAVPPLPRMLDHKVESPPASNPSRSLTGDLEGQYRPPSSIKQHNQVQNTRYGPQTSSPPAASARANEALALSRLSEAARGGRPRLAAILTEEVELSQGAIGVACCGPTSLNCLVRKIVAARIDPSRVRLGDPRGSITLISEEFEY